MWRKKYLFNVEGEISQVILNDSAEITFVTDGKTEKALLKKGRFYHNGRLIPDNVPFSKYIRNGMQVKFSCHILEPQKGTTPNLHHVQYNWYTIMCWANNKESPLTEVSISFGLFGRVGTIIKITKRHGILAMIDSAGDEERIAFLASKAYIHGKRFSSSKMLTAQLCLDEKMMFDAVPCIPEENRENCKWFATCVYQGKRPRLANTCDIIGMDFPANNPIEKPNAAGTDKDRPNYKLNQFQQSYTNLKSQLLKVINLHTSDPRTLFTTGYGFIFDILNDEFGIILGCFKKNVFQTILFHRRNAFLFKVPLARAKLTEIFVEGDHMKFIAVGAPPNFYTDWIALQVSVTTEVYRDVNSAAI